MPTEDQEMKVTARIDKILYTHVMEKFYHGQQTLFFRNIFKSLSIMIKNDRFNEVTDYLYKGKELRLPAIED